MRQIFGLAALVFVGVAAWRIGGQLSSDAIGMAVGVLFGIMAGVPTALLVMASSRRREPEPENDERMARRKQQAQMHPAYQGGYGHYPQPPVIVLAAPGGQAPQGYGQPYGQGYGQGYGNLYQQPLRALNAPDTVDVRQFKVVGEKEEWVDEW